jgi:hypothetical protein
MALTINTAATVLVSAACANAGDQKAPALTVESVPTVAAELGQVESAPSIGAGLQRLVDMATENLAANLKIEVAAIKLAEAEYVTWRDGSIGCPKVGEQYTQALVNGSRIVLKADGKAFHYHSGANRAPTYCENPAPQEPLPYYDGET